MNWRSLLKARWAALGAREQRAVALAGAVLLLALLWLVALAPALRTVREDAARRNQLGSELENMQRLQAQAQRLQAQPVLSRLEVQSGLQSAANALGKAARLQVVGDRATLTLTQLGAASLAPWLAAQAGNGLSPAEMHLQRDPGSADALWNGTLVFQLPANTNP